MYNTPTNVIPKKNNNNKIIWSVIEVLELQQQ